MDAPGQRRVAEQVRAGAGRILAGVLRVHRERHFPGKQQAARDRRLLVGGVLPYVGVEALIFGRIENCPQQVGYRAASARTAPKLHQAVQSQRPAARRLHGKLDAAEARIAAGERALVEDVIGLRQPRLENLVKQPQARERLVVGQAHRGHGRRLRAHQHAAVGEGREPMRLVADVELRLAEADAQHRAGVVLAAVVGHGTRADQGVVAGLQVDADGGIPGAAVVQAVTVGKDRVCAVGACAFDAGVREIGSVGVAGEIVRHPLA